MNGDANTNAENGFEPIPRMNVCVVINTMLNFDGDAKVNVKCKQSLKLLDDECLICAYVHSCTRLDDYEMFGQQVELM